MGQHRLPRYGVGFWPWMAEFVVISAPAFCLMANLWQWRECAGVFVSTGVETALKQKIQAAVLATAWVLRFYSGANDRNRTDDLFITSELLYRLSYIGETAII